MTEHSDKQNRRKGPDIWLYMIQLIGMISWALMLPLLYLVDRAKPQFETLFDKMFDLQVRSTWDLDLYKWAVLLMFFLLFISGVGLIINKTRSRRREDYYRINLIIIFLLSAAGILYYVKNFLL